MSGLIFTKGLFPEQLLRPTVEYILNTQNHDGSIPWFGGGKTDPWDHTEASMGLSIGGEFEAARRAYQWLADQQLEDGSWWAHYQGNDPVNADHRETNFVAYVATGVWHHYLVTEDQAFLRHFFPMVEKAVEFVLRYQADTGEIYWAVDDDGAPQKDALVTACSSIFKSLECAINIASSLGQQRLDWVRARQRLQNTLHYHPECFDRTWDSKARYSMDWFYPILTGVITGAEAIERIDKRWSTFVEHELGCRCVCDEPWVTVAETCELTMALLAAGDRGRATNVYSWMHQFVDKRDGGYWTGYVFPDKTIWPEEKTTWTAAAILMAADALTDHTGAARLFINNHLLNEEALLKAALDGQQLLDSTQ